MRYIEEDNKSFGLGETPFPGKLILNYLAEDTVWKTKS